MSLKHHSFYLGTEKDKTYNDPYNNNNYYYYNNRSSDYGSSRYNY